VTAAVPSSPLDPHDYRHVVGRFGTGVTVVATVQDDIRYAMTVNSFTSVSLEPLLVLFCCERDASLHEPLLASGIWGVTLLSVNQQDEAEWFATRGVPGADQFAGRAATSGPVTGAPLLREGLAWLECRTWATYDGGDHTIVVGEVVDLALGSDESPLLYWRSTYRTVRPD
jgi:flavin reductase (DIM6/NTAB) family NADH-FMN oxidoreductase RutF